MAKVDPAAEKKPQVEVKKALPRDAARKSEPPAVASENEETGQSTILMRHPSAFEQLVEKILKKHKI